MYVYIYIYIYIFTYIYIYLYIYICIYDSKIKQTNNNFKSFYPKYFADNQIGKITENDFFPRFNILSFTR